jgi:uncharacterized repeat protein (TIGR03806 family)
MQNVNSTLFWILVFVCFFTLGCQNKSNISAPTALKVKAEMSLLNHVLTDEKKFLSEYGFFKGPIAELIPNSDVYPYDINNPLFSDYALKKRFVFLPSGNKMKIEDSGEVTFEVGSILIKNFYYPADYNDEETKVRNIETRLLIKGEEGWKPLNYIWNKDQTDAELNFIGDKQTVQFTDANYTTRSFSYQIPNLNECKNCHIKGKDITPIGPTIAQLNKKYSFSEEHLNQLETFQNWSLIDLPIHPFKLSKLPVWNDTKATLEDRAKAYLDANCAHCHNSKGSAKNSGLFLTFDENDLRKRGILKPPVAAGKGSGDLEFSILPGHPEASILVYRMKSIDPAIQMPEIGRTLVHQEGVALLEDYIRTLTFKD